jgi:hypothetical protein
MPSPDVMIVLTFQVFLNVGATEDRGNVGDRQFPITDGMRGPAARNGIRSKTETLTGAERRPE